MRTLSSALLLLLAAALLPDRLAAQRHEFTDRSLSGSLLLAGLPSPSFSRGLMDADALPREVFRFETQYSRILLSESAVPVLIVGMRTDHLRRDSTGIGAAVLGVRVGFHALPGEGQYTVPSMVELHAGGRTLGYLDHPGRPDVGFDLVAGWSDLQGEMRGTLGFRLPVELVRLGERGWVSFSAAPTIAWGHIRFRGCEDRGPGDNCGDLGVQLEFGRTRFLLAGGASVGWTPLGLSLSVGAQQLLANGQDPRLIAGVAWAP